MVLVKLQGGLGNQMFQYAAARGLSKNKQCIYLDHSFLDINRTDTEHFTARSYELHIFKNIKACKARIWQIGLFKSQSIYFKYARFFFKTSIKYIQQQENEYISLSGLLKNTNVYLDGYFQSEKYFKHIRKQLLEEFRFPQLDALNEDLKQRIVNTPNAVSIHIRRSDYLKSKVILQTHGVLPFKYYHNALDVLQSKYPALSLFIFSDDMSWAKANFKREGTNICFVDHNQSIDSWKDMILMSYCKHQVIANSSFSWWGAWLSQNGGEVFAPYHWFNSLKVDFNILDFIPDHWTIVNYG